MPFDGSNPFAIFSFLTTFRRAFDTAGLTHGQAFPLLAFRLSGAAKRSLASAMNNTSASKRYALKTYGDGINWLLAKYATQEALSSAYHNIITLKQGDDEAPRAFGTRVGTLCDRLDGLFHNQDVKDVFVNGLSEIIRPHVSVLDGQFRDRSSAKTVTAAQMYWVGANQLRQSMRPPRAHVTKVGLIGETSTSHQTARTVDHPFPDRRPRPGPSPPTSPRPKADVRCNCRKPGHWSRKCAEPHRPGLRRDEPTHNVQAVVEDDSVEDPAMALADEHWAKN